jgi:hypothetical protein
VGQGVRSADEYQPIRANAADRLPSLQLGLELAIIVGHVRFFLPGATTPLPTREERAERVEREAARLREELENLRRAQSSRSS